MKHDKGNSFLLAVRAIVMCCYNEYIMVCSKNITHTLSTGHRRVFPIFHTWCNKNTGPSGTDLDSWPRDFLALSTSRLLQAFLLSHKFHGATASQDYLSVRALLGWFLTEKFHASPGVPNSTLSQAASEYFHSERDWKKESNYFGVSIGTLSFEMAAPLSPKYCEGTHSCSFKRNISLGNVPFKLA